MFLLQDPGETFYTYPEPGSFFILWEYRVMSIFFYLKYPNALCGKPGVPKLMVLLYMVLIHKKKVEKPHYIAIIHKLLDTINCFYKRFHVRLYGCPIGYTNYLGISAGFSIL